MHLRGSFSQILPPRLVLTHSMANVAIGRDDVEVCVCVCVRETSYVKGEHSHQGRQLVIRRRGTDNTQCCKCRRDNENGLF